jgi:hypothetical protein
MKIPYLGHSMLRIAQECSVAVALTWPYLSASPITIAFGQPHASWVSRLLLVRHPIPGRVGEPSPI